MNFGGAAYIRRRRYDVHHLLIAAAILVTGRLPGGTGHRPSFGKCGTLRPRGGIAITPAQPGRLTVQAHLPAPAWWNGARRGRISGRFRVLPRGQHRARPASAGRGGRRRLAGRWRRRLVLGGDARGAGPPVRPRAGRRSRSPPSARKHGRLLACPISLGHRPAWPRPAAGSTSPLDPACASGTGGHHRGPLLARELQPNRPARVRRRAGDVPGAAERPVDVAMTDTAILLSQGRPSGGRFEVVGSVRPASSTVPSTTRARPMRRCWTRSSRP